MAETDNQVFAHARIRNIAGIESSEIEFPDGISILTGRNATNRTSLLQALMAALGSNRATLKADADEGSVELAIGDETYTRTLRRTGNSIHFDGEPYLDDPTLADLFAFLLESNEARRAVAQSDDLREVIMEPVDTDAIEREINQLETERDDIDAELEELESHSRRLPDLEEERVELETAIEEKRAELAEKEAEIDELDSDVDKTRQDKAELEEALEDLRSVRADLERTRSRIDSEEESIDALEEEREEVETALQELSDVPEERITSIDEDVQRLRGQVQAIESTISELQSIIQFNQDTLEEGQSGLVSELETDDEGSATDELVGGDETVCWTCGSTVDSGQIEATIERLRDLHQRKNDRRQSLRDEISTLQDERDELDAQRSRSAELQRKRRQIDEEIQERETRLEELRDDRDELTDRVDELENEVQELQNDDYSDVLDLHSEANQIEFELERLEADLEDVEGTIDQIEERLERREQLEAQREELVGELNSLRTRIEDLERAAVEEFNDHMDAILDRLEYANLERIWIERTEQEMRDGRQTVTRGVFDLHVVRSTADGTVYEDTVDHLSESEREVTGLVFALAGYLAHEVYDEVPFMLLDSVEAIDSDRIASLVEYLEEFAEYLVVALLPEDAAALREDVHRITEI